MREDEMGECAMNFIVTILTMLLFAMVKAQDAAAAVTTVLP
jgi:hypothetical protein